MARRQERVLHRSASRHRPGALAFGLATLTVLAVALAGLLGFHRVNGGWPWSVADEGPQIGGPFSLVDGSGRTVTDQTFRGKWLVVFFGYTHCPDVCPTMLGEVAEALGKLGPLANRIQPLFITVDPARDTPAVIRAFTEAIDTPILGLTGSLAQVEAMAQAYRAYHKTGGSGADLVIDHIAVLYIMRPDGSFAGILPSQSEPPVIADSIRNFIIAS
jgi:protein SCO1/2